jgi:hypothetical protein
MNHCDWIPLRDQPRRKRAARLHSMKSVQKVPESKSYVMRHPQGVFSPALPWASNQSLPTRTYHQNQSLNDDLEAQTALDDTSRAPAYLRLLREK